MNETETQEQDGYVKVSIAEFPADRLSELKAAAGPALSRERVPAAAAVKWAALEWCKQLKKKI